MNVWRWIAALPVRLRTILRRTRAEKDLDDLGGVPQTKERYRDAWPLRWAEDLLHDSRYALRGLRRAPAFTSIAITVLALGIGANTALFSVVSAVLLRPLPYPDSNRLVRIWSAMPAQGYPRSPSALPDYRMWRTANHAFEEMGASHETIYNLTGVDPPERLLAARMTASMWRVLEPQPVLGAVFSADTEQWGHHRVVVLSEGLWRRRFGADSSSLGRTVQLNGQPFTIIGVVPRSFQYPSTGTELWTPEAFAPGDAMGTRANHFVDVIGRLKPGETVAGAQADLAVIAAQIKTQFPENAGIDVTMRSWREDIVGDVRPTLLLLFGGVGLVLLIACTNVANLVLARAIARRQELTIRVALGADRGRLAQQLLAENMVLASLGALAGLGLAFLLVQSLTTLGAIGIPRIHEVTLDRVAIACAAALAVLTGLGFGLWPLRHLHDVDLGNDLKESAQATGSGVRQVRGRRVLLVAEVTLSVVLLVGAGLLIASLVRLQRVDPGFRPDHVLTASVNLDGGRYANPERITQVVRELTEHIAAIPGVQAAAAGTAIPLGQTGWGKYFSVDGRPAPSSLAQVPNVEYRQITPAYFRALGATVGRGRSFADSDVDKQPAIAVVNDTLAQRFWPHDDPIGQRVSLNAPESLVASEIREAIAAGVLPKDFGQFPRLTIVGVVHDLRESGLDRETKPTLYVPVAQALPPHEDAARAFFLVVRTSTDPLVYRQAIQAVVHRLDPTLPLANVRTMETSVSESLARRRFAMLLLSAFAAIALVLVVAGLYGVMTYVTNQRQREFGLRMAMGATSEDLVRLVLAQGLVVMTIGIPAGLVIAIAFSRFISGQLFEVKPLDPSIYAETALTMAIVGLMACAVPALRASRIDPATTLRHD